MRSAHAEWETNDNNCLIPDNSAMNFTYKGTTNLGVGQNGVNTVGFGPFPVWDCSSGNAGCSKEWTRFGDPDHYAEADIRLNSGFRWQNGTSGGSNEWDVWHVMAHEVGHNIGFDHVSDTNQVMWPNFGPDSISNRQLGEGDARENNAKY
jgi:hypothetical protein